jgi:hypothetical protein
MGSTARCNCQKSSGPNFLFGVFSTGGPTVDTTDQQIHSLFVCFSKAFLVITFQSKIQNHSKNHQIMAVFKKFEGKNPILIF